MFNRTDDVDAVERCLSRLSIREVIRHITPELHDISRFDVVEVRAEVERNFEFFLRSMERGILEIHVQHISGWFDSINRFPIDAKFFDPEIVAHLCLQFYCLGFKDRHFPIKLWELECRSCVIPLANIQFPWLCICEAELVFPMNISLECVRCAQPIGGEGDIADAYRNTIRASPVQYNFLQRAVDGSGDFHFRTFEDIQST